jgi:hypothetical protein
MLLLFPLNAYAADNTQEIAIPVSTSDNIPPQSDISDDLGYSEGFASAMQCTESLLTRGLVNGGCSITKLSSTKLRVTGFSTCSSSNPALSVALSLQAYYNGAWHTLKTKVSTISGTRVDLSQNYIVTSGYYYRVRGYHSLADGTSTTSSTSGILVE